MKTFVVCLIIITIASAVPAHADYHYASHTGSNTYPYASWETAAEIIDSAIYASSPFDTIFIGPGTFDQLIRQRNQDSCLTFIGAGSDSTILTENTSPNHLAGLRQYAWLGIWLSLSTA